jgi:hypothetical protein
MAIIGIEDDAGSPPVEETINAKGGHLSPFEAPKEVTILINRLIKLIPEDLPAY